MSFPDYSYELYNRSEYRTTCVPKFHVHAFYWNTDIPWANTFLCPWNSDFLLGSVFEEEVSFARVINPPEHLVDLKDPYSNDELVGPYYYNFIDSYQEYLTPTFYSGFVGRYEWDTATGIEVIEGTTSTMEVSRWQFKANLGRAYIVSTTPGGPYGNETEGWRVIGSTYDNKNGELYKDEAEVSDSITSARQAVRQWAAAAYCGEYMSMFGVGATPSGWPEKNIVTVPDEDYRTVYVGYGDPAEIDRLNENFGTPIESDVHYAYNKYIGDLKIMCESIYLTSTTDRRFSMKQKQSRPLHKTNVMITEGVDARLDIDLRTTKITERTEGY